MPDGSRVIPEVLLSTERASHLALALHDLLRTHQPPEALPALARVAGVIYLETCESAEVLGDMLGTEAASARQGGPVG
jgi:hypothetical protein